MLFVRSSLCLFIVLLVACEGQATSTPIPIQPSSSPTPTDVIQPAITQTITASATPSQERSCEDWQSLPVIPGVSETAREIYRRGQGSGNNSSAFSKIGDGEISTAWFFTAFDLGEEYYDLGPYQDLRLVIDQFRGSFERIGMAARRGFNTDKILNPAMSDPAACAPDESPLMCELRLHQPAFAILSLGTNQVWEPEEFEAGMRRILEILLSQNVVPILSTKGDNLEGDHRINRTIACLAEEHDLPLWNFWSAIQPLPNHGLQPDLEHLTYYGKTDFDDSDAMQSAWTVRNLTALQALDAVWKGVAAQP
ncbi:MAG TPA: SGNH/GDSL hydrolase family protein [Anaerolineales bacterium]|nr:SGNH/GDSL hydrolase family protein [Anaerolineales bacterium]